MTTAKTVSTNTANDHSQSYEFVGRQAWILLWIAFSLFILLVTGIPLSINWYLHNATIPRYSQVEAIRGTTLVIEDNSDAATAVIGVWELQGGELIRTDDTARANVSVYAAPGENDSLTTAQLRSNSDLVFISARTPRFRQSELPDQVRLRLNVGRARVTSNNYGDQRVVTTVETPHGFVYITNGSAAIAVSNEATEVSARSGEVIVAAQNRKVVLTDGRRSIIQLNQPPSLPLATEQNLIVNGDFSQPLESAWKIERVVDASDPSSLTYGEVSIVDSGGRRAVYFVRDGEEGIHTETAITQELDADVLDYDSLRLRLDVRLISQSLPGGGIQSSEFPLMVRIDFIDVDGQERFWTHGFYAVDPVANWPIRDGEKIPNFVWYEYESPDFLNSPTFPRPQKVTRIRVYASGHNYRSQVSDIGLIAK